MVINTILPHQVLVWIYLHFTVTRSAFSWSERVESTFPTVTDQQHSLTNIINIYRGEEISQQILSTTDKFSWRQYISSKWDYFYRALTIKFYVQSGRQIYNYLKIIRTSLFNSVFVSINFLLKIKYDEGWINVILKKWQWESCIVTNNVFNRL